MHDKLEPGVDVRSHGVPPEELRRGGKESRLEELSKEMIHKPGNVEGFELCQLSERTQCPHCMRYSMKRVVYFDSGTCVIPSEQVRRLIKEGLDVLTIPVFTIKRRRRGKAYHKKQKMAARKARTNNLKSIQERFRNLPVLTRIEDGNQMDGGNLFARGRPCSGGPLTCCDAC